VFPPVFASDVVGRQSRPTCDAARLCVSMSLWFTPRRDRKRPEDNVRRPELRGDEDSR